MYMSSQAAGMQAPDGLRLGRYLALSVAVTLAVTMLPLVAVSQLGPARSPLAIALHVAAAVAMSVLLARVLAALWTRHEQSSDLVFGDLLIWGWARRALAERRLDATARELAAPVVVDENRVALLRRMSGLLETRDPYTHGHSRRVARHSERIAREIGLPREQVAKIRAAALVHDIGKINVPRSILTKPGKLTDEEFALVKRHPGDGAAMVVELRDPELTAIVRHHHERMDGTGYPDGLAGGDIPIGARVIAVADTFDAITSTRAYRTPRTHKQAIEILQREAGTQLDSIAVAAFVSYYASGRSVGFASLLAAAPQRLISGFGGVQSGVAASVAPIAQTACGVGGVALIGACLGGPMLPAATKADADPHSAAARQVASQAGAPHAADQGDARSRDRDRRPVAERGEQGTVQTPTERGAPRSLERPGTSAPGGGQSNPGSGGGGGSGATVPTVSDLPELVSDVQNALEPVTDNVQLPHLQAPQLPAPAPPIGVP
jgi:putative nucleotidyltransferase with HDIG domain